MMLKGPVSMFPKETMMAKGSIFGGQRYLER